MTDIYLAIARTEYEGFSVICAFTDKKTADTFANDCAEYELTKEPYPEDDADEFFDPWIIRNQKWKELHPAGEHCEGTDYYEVATVAVRS